MAKKGLYANIHAKRKRIASGSGEKMRKPGSKGAPTAAAFRKSFKDIADKAKDGTLSIKDQEDAQKSLQKSLEAYQSKSRMGAKLNSAENKARIAGIKQEQANLQVLITQEDANNL